MPIIPQAAQEVPAIPDHELLRRIGAGSYGEVWLGRTVIGKYRAIKVIYRSNFEHDRPFEREFEGIQKFEPISRAHPSQLAILHVGRNEAEGYFYYVMELADDASAECGVRSAESDAKGPLSIPQSAIRNPHLYEPRTLKLDLYRRGRLPLEECIQIGLSLTTALEHLHAHELVHRDIKPSNIIFVNGTPKLADIGLVASLDATMSFVGTSGFVPPEGPGTPQADIYSLGKVLYEMSMGRDRQDFPKLPGNLAEFGDPARLLELNAIILKACHAERGRRYLSARAMAADLELLQSGHSVRRLRAVERRLAIVTKIGLGVAAAAVMAVAAYFGAVKQVRRAQRAEQITAQQLYVSDLNRAYQFWDKGKLRQALDLLEAHHPRASERNDVRSFEWFYLWQLCHKDEALHTFRAHSNPVGSLTFSPQGETFITVDHGGAAALWGASTREKLSVFTNCNDAVFSPDGTLLALAYRSNSVALWSPLARRVVLKLEGTKQDYQWLRFSPDGKVLAALEFDNTTVTLWDVASGRLYKTLSCEEGGYLYSAAFSPDGKIFVVGHRDNLLTFYDTASWQRTADMDVPVGFVSSLAFSPDSRTLALGGIASEVVLVDLASRRITSTLTAHEGEVTAVVFSPDSQRFATASSDTTVKLWSASSHQLQTTFKGHLDRVTAIAFAPDGKTIASGCADGSVKVWAIAPRPDPDVLVGHTNWVRSVAFSPDGKTLASAGKDKTVKLWDVASRRLAFTLPGHRRPVYRLAWSPDGKTLSTVSGLITEESGVGEVKLWDAIAHRELVTLTNLNNPVCSVAFSPDSQILATGNGDGSVMLWNAATHEHVATLRAHKGLVNSVAFSANGKILASGSADNTAKLWDVISKQRLAVIPGSPGNATDLDYGIWSMAFSPDTQTLALGNEDGTVTLWDLARRQLVRTFKGTTGRVYSIAFTADGRTLVAGTQDNTIVLWNVVTGQEMAALKGHQGFIESVAFSPGGSLLASACSDKTVRLWRAATRAETDASLAAK